MGKKTEFLILVLTLFGHFIGTKAAVVPFFILFGICRNAIFGILLVSALAVVLVGRTLNVTSDLKPRQKVLFELPLDGVFAGFFDICKALVMLAITLLSQSSEILLTTATICAEILEDCTAGGSPTLGLVGVFFQRFGKEDLQKTMGKTASMNGQMTLMKMQTTNEQRSKKRLTWGLHGWASL